MRAYRRERGKGYVPIAHNVVGTRDNQGQFEYSTTDRKSRKRGRAEREGKEYEGEGWGDERFGEKRTKQALTSIPRAKGCTVRVVGPSQMRQTVSGADRSLKSRALTSGISRISLGMDFPALFSVFVVA